MTTGDGGMMVTNRAELAEYARKSRWLGIDKDTWKRSSTTAAKDSKTDWYYEISQAGYKYNMNNIGDTWNFTTQKLDKIRNRKNTVVEEYKKAFSLYLASHYFRTNYLAKK